MGLPNLVNLMSLLMCLISTILYLIYRIDRYYIAMIAKNYDDHFCRSVKCMITCFSVHWSWCNIQNNQNQTFPCTTKTQVIVFFQNFELLVHLQRSDSDRNRSTHPYTKTNWPISRIFKLVFSPFAQCSYVMCYEKCVQPSAYSIYNTRHSIKITPLSFFLDTAWPCSWYGSYELELRRRPPVASAKW